MRASDLVESLPAAGGPVVLAEAQGWLQGRTLYGGTSALIAYHAVRRAYPDLPPLRGAQVAFIAPLGATFEIRRAVLRQGRNVAAVRSELWGEDGPAVTATWLFGTAREANARHRAAPLADWPGPPEDALEAADPRAPAFVHGNFAMRKPRAAAPAAAAAKSAGGPAPVVRRWARLRDPGTLDAVSQAILMGDLLPPGAARTMARPGPLSSINWSFNLLDPAPATREGWWLVETAAQHADHGYSSERLRLWNAAGEQILDGMQCTAIFG